MSPSTFFIVFCLGFLMQYSSSATTFKSEQRENLPLELLEDCDLKIHFPASISSAGCVRGFNEHGYVILDIEYFLQQFIHNEAVRYISGIVEKNVFEKYMDGGARGVVVTRESGANGQLPENRKPILQPETMESLCARSELDIERKAIKTDNWSGYLWARRSRPKHADLTGKCMTSDLSDTCFVAIIGNRSRILHFGPTCLPTNRKKTHPADFDFEDFLKMIHSIRFNTN
ncbi:hypothetical protein Hrubri_0197 [Herbaspirillum rubrisubalbicans M1]|uniref:hypothetical protein n=1 Tax=Herbaspirillum rubrisubalbicans TaxID=80842 RepID=UPI00073A0E41|nr:hypothetical protein [Herbaspirillum rubrisubalbicans]ALU87426.1 hypothetical protein Hrubri_0197 [Herbaspirillum rubrisubalbicans M1]